jgi:hypothetical protein
MTADNCALHQRELSTPMPTAPAPSGYRILAPADAAPDGVLTIDQW